MEIKYFQFNLFLLFYHLMISSKVYQCIGQLESILGKLSSIKQLSRNNNNHPKNDIYTHITYNIMIDKQEQHHFLLFVNSKSGGCKGKEYLTIGQETLKLKSKYGFLVYVNAYDMYNKLNRQAGFKKVLDLTKVSKNVNVIICGGDGTVLWVVNEALSSGINAQQVCFGIIPIGTGNDFSRSLGWGGSPINFTIQNLRELRKLIQKWVRASKQNFDLWDVNITTYQGGNITPSSSNVQKQTTDRKTQMFRTFSNYLGIGIDARVSYHFQKNRTQSKLINLALYGCIGLFCCLKKTDKMHKAIQQFSQSQSESEGSNLDESQSIKEVLTDDRKGIELLEKNMSTQLSEVRLKKGYTGLVCLNCTSYMSGVKNIFNSSKIGSKNKHHKDFTEQKFNDGKLEFVGFKNQLSLGLERFIHTAAKLTQGCGPFTIKFKPQKKQTFIQIDGQAVLVQSLKQVKIVKSKLGQIKVLVHQK